MTDNEKTKIKELRQSGLGYGAIATKLGLNRNSVKSFLQRLDKVKEDVVCKCLYCGKEMNKRTRFCSDICRLKHWKLSHQGNETTCAFCGKKFFSYPSRKRKYCSPECYNNGRMGN